MKEQAINKKKTTRRLSRQKGGCEMEKASGLRIESMERIASALERIADALEKQDAGNQMVMVDGRVFGKLVDD